MSARTLYAKRHWADADFAIRSAEAAAVLGEHFALIGDFLAQIQDFPRARGAYEQALTLQPDEPTFLFNHAAVLRFLGLVGAAEDSYDRVIAVNRRDTEAWYNRSELRTQTLDRNHVDELEACLAEGFEVAAREAHIRYALAKEYEDLGRHRDAWRNLAIGAAVRRRHIQYDVAVDVATVDWIRTAFGRPDQSLATHPSEAPIFIVGMPRTGTTLLERILGGCPRVFAAGELNDFAAALVAAVHRRLGRSAVQRRDMVSAAATVNFSELGADYIERTRPRTNAASRFTDKMPLNYLYCGLIRRSLGNARILHMTRHPMATCYAVFKTLFKQGYPFSYDLGEIAEYYIAYHRLMEHWHQMHSGQILDVSYERLVTQAESEGGNVFEHCGLAWESNALEIHRRTTAVTTPSASQIRQPIYTSSIDAWRYHESELSAVIRSLRRAGIRVD
jgi:tetratricopeptide (TPR) repeat protein